MYSSVDTMSDNLAPRRDIPFTLFTRIRNNIVGTSAAATDIV